jgi:hypothetical protein
MEELDSKEEGLTYTTSLVYQVCGVVDYAPQPFLTT